MTDKEKYKKELLDKYLNKNLSVDERHELERLALDDSFLFEALQGFAEAEGEHGKDISALRKQVLSGAKPKKSRGFFPYGVAASLLVVLGMSLWLTKGTFGLSNKNVPMASKEVADQVTVLQEPVVAEVVQNGTELVKEEGNEVFINKNAEEDDDVMSDKSEAKAAESFDRAKEQKNILPPTNPRNSVIDDAVVQSAPISQKEVKKNEEAIIESVIVSSDLVLNESTQDEEVEKPEEEVAEEAEYAMDVVAGNSQPTASPKAKKQSGLYEMERDSEDAAGQIQASSTVANSKDGIDPFEVSFKKKLKEMLTDKELESLGQQVTLTYNIKDGVVSNFQVDPSNNARISGVILSILQSEAKLLAEQNAESVEYVINL